MSVNITILVMGTTWSVITLLEAITVPVYMGFTSHVVLMNALVRMYMYVCIHGKRCAQSDPGKRQTAVSGWLALVSALCIPSCSTMA